jgi:uncharacterized protein (DUF2252 family)
MLRDVKGEIEKLDAPWQARRPELVRAKHDKMRESPRAFFRATAPLFFVRLREALEPGTPLRLWLEGDEKAPVSLVWCAGDVHFENFGAYRSNDGVERFGLNDFDDALVAPVEIDVLRLAASIHVAARDKGLAATDSAALVKRALERYRAHAKDDAFDPDPKDVPAKVAKLLALASDASRADFIEKRAPLVKGKRAFVATDHYRPLQGAERTRVLDAFQKAAAPIAGHESAGYFGPVDVAARTAGLGSLGCGRYAVLVTGGAKGNVLLELKEAKPAALTRHGCPTRAFADEADRVVQGTVALRGERSPYLSRAVIDGVSFYLRRLSHKEQRIDLDDLEAADLGAVVEAEATALARAHSRSRKALGLEPLALELDPLEPLGERVRREWTLLAAWLAGTVEGDWTAWCS